MDGARMAALAVHGLHGKDRAWLLAQLPPNDCGRLVPLLEELADIGLSRDTARMQSQIASSHVRNEPVAPATPLDRLRQAKLDEVFAALDGEPAALVAACLLADKWTWRDEFVARLDPQRRAEVADLLRDHAVAAQAPRMRETLLVKLDARVRAPAMAPAKRKALVSIVAWLEARWKTR